LLAEFSVASNGEIFSSSFDVSNERWRCPTTGTLLIDDEYKSTKSLRFFEWKSPDEFILITQERTIDGEKAPDTRATFRAVR
jgi:hypothetical protein